MKSKRHARRPAPSVQPPMAKQPPTAWKPWAGAAALLLLVAIIYGPTRHNGFVSDDRTYVETNAALDSLSGLSDIWFKLGTVEQYYPLVHTTFWIENHLWGLDPAGYHVVNLLLHALAAVLLWRLLAILEVPGAWLGAALFAVHPIEVESVAWVSERKNMLSCVLALLSLLAYFQFSPPGLPPPAHQGPGRGRWIDYALALVFYLAALLSKSVTVSVPAVVLVIIWWKRGRVTWRDVAPLLPWFAIGLAMGCLTIWMEKTFVGAQGEAWNFTVIERFLIAGRALWFYAGKLFWPYPLMFYYPRWTIDPRALWQYVYPLAVVAVLVGLWLARRRIGRGPLAAVLIFCGVLSPAIGFINVFPFRLSFVADHYQYHAGIALLALAAAGLALAAGRLPARAAWLAPLGCAALLAPLTIEGRLRTHAYRDEFTLHSDTVALNPDAFASQNNLAIALLQAGQLDGAIRHFSEALRIHPELARLHNNLASALHSAGRLDEAESELTRSLACDANPTDRAGAHVVFAFVRTDQGHYDAAIKHALQALAIDPRDSWALYACGSALAKRGDVEAAIPKLRDALRENPAIDEAQHLLGKLLAASGQPHEAARHLEQAVRLRDHSASYHVDLAGVLIELHEWEAADSQLQRALELDGKDADAHNLLGVLLLERGDPLAAGGEFQRALADAPNHPAAQANLKKAQEAAARAHSPAIKPRAQAP